MPARRRDHLPETPETLSGGALGRLAAPPAGPRRDPWRGSALSLIVSLDPCLLFSAKFLFNNCSVTNADFFFWNDEIDVHSFLHILNVCFNIKLSY